MDPKPNLPNIRMLPFLKGQVWNIKRMKDVKTHAREEQLTGAKEDWFHQYLHYFAFCFTNDYGFWNNHKPTGLIRYFFKARLAKTFPALHSLEEYEGAR